MVKIVKKIDSTDFKIKWHPSSTPTLKKRFIDFSLLKKTLEKLYLKSKEEQQDTVKLEEQKKRVLDSPPSLSHWSSGKWDPLTPTLRNIDFKQLRKTIERLYMNHDKPIDVTRNYETKLEKTLKF